ncbi:unnamed protein product [Linum tenue]|uniref:Uncharacterized protein n=1 Tax=Linum tenue TaxID=586396 RepID=A0AAV0RDD6_9ROSI|nr:unnamed protein product [Linum tenue]
MLEQPKTGKFAGQGSSCFGNGYRMGYPVFGDGAIVMAGVSPCVMRRTDHEGFQPRSSFMAAAVFRIDFEPKFAAEALRRTSQRPDPGQCIKTLSSK